MRFSLWLVSLLTFLSCTVLEGQADETKKDYFVFLTTGKATDGVSPEDIKKKQAAHLENFGRLAKLGLLTVAGPCSDPDKSIRGIVVIHAESISVAEDYFKPDPYVSEGFMNVELHHYQTVAGRLQLVSEMTSLEQSVLVILSQGDHWPTEPSQTKLMEASLAKMAKESFETKKLGFAVSFNVESNNKSKRVAVMIFRGKDLDPVLSILESQEAIKSGAVQFTAFKQYMAKGAIPD
jgi:uncharacterized protein YciI